MPATAAGTALRSPVLAALLAALCLYAATATARDFEIGYHERVSLPRGGAAPHLSFIAHGRQFDLELAANNAILALPGEPSVGNVALYRGRLSGQANSWVRLSDRDGRLSGAIYDGSELWLLDTHANVSGYFASPEPQRDDTTVMFRLSEVGGTFGDVIATDFIATAADDTRLPQPLLPFVPDAAAPAQPGRVLDIALVASADFRQRHGPAARDVLLEMFNIVEGIFLTQAGVQLRAAEVVMFETEPAWLNGTDAVRLLDRFGAYKSRTPTLSELGLAHLFVSRDLDDTAPPIRTVGIANLGTVCSERYGVGITEAAHSTTFDALIAAHEIGHNFGAPHDGETGSVCAAESASYIMGAQISGGSRFSQCSLAIMHTELETATCTREMPPADLQLRVAAPPPSSVRVDDALELELELANLSSTRVAGLTLTAAASGLSTPTLGTWLPGDGRCERQTELQCVWPWFEAGSSAAVRLELTGRIPGPGNITVTVGSLNELDTSDNLLSFDIEVLPRYMLAGRLSPTTISLDPGESARFAAGIANYGAQSLTDVQAHIQSGSDDIEIVDVALPNCTSGPQPNDITCSVGTLGPRSLRNFSVMVRIPNASAAPATALAGIASITLTATSSESTATAAHVVQAQVEIGDTHAATDAAQPRQAPALDQAPNESAATGNGTKSGGGLFDLLALLVLALTCAARRRIGFAERLSD